MEDKTKQKMLKCVLHLNQLMKEAFFFILLTLLFVCFSSSSYNNFDL